MTKGSEFSTVLAGSTVTLLGAGRVRSFFGIALGVGLSIRVSWKRMTRIGIQMTNGSEHVPEFPSGVVGQVWRELQTLGRLFYSPQQEEE
jgi:hypothetical protein